MKMQTVCIFLTFLLVSAQPLLAADEQVATMGFRAYFILIIIIFGLFFLAWALKKYGPVARVKKSLGLDVLGQVALSTKANLALVRVGKSILLIGVTQNNISLIKDLEEGDFEKAVKELDAAQGMS